MGKGRKGVLGICIAYDVLMPLVKKDVVVSGDDAPNIKRALSSLVCYLARKSEHKRRKSLKTPLSRDDPQKKQSTVPDTSQCTEGLQSQCCRMYKLYIQYNTKTTLRENKCTTRAVID